jgi:hypothetical protein
MTTDNTINSLGSVAIPDSIDSATEMLEDGSMLVDLDVAEGEDDSIFLEVNFKDGHYVNLVDDIDEDELDDIAERILKDIEDAEMSREDWMKSLDMGYQTRRKEHTFPRSL